VSSFLPIATFGCGFHHVLEGSAGAGFAGLRTAEVEQFRVAGKPPADTLLTDSVDLHANFTQRWRPALSTGVVFHWYADKSLTSTEMGFGVGGHIVFVPDATGKTAPFPAFTFHVGNPSTEAFVGVILEPSEGIGFPNGKSAYRVHVSPSQAIPDFTRPDWRKSHNLYVGIKIAGIRQSEPTTMKSAVSITITPSASEVEVGQTITVATVIFAQDQTRIDAAPDFTVSDPKIATIETNGVLTGKAPGSVTVTAMRDGVKQTTTISVIAKK
jgi:hypothetical protein